MPTRSEAWVLGVIALLGALVFTLWPQLDLALAGLFYTPGQGFTLGETLFAQAVYWGIWWGSRIAVGASLLLWLASLIARTGPLARYRRWFGFLLLSFALGPGLITDVALKNHWGRARPHQITQFGGTRHFTPALLPANQCERNCAFVSGHVSGACAPMAFGWLAARRRRHRWLIGCAIAGAVTGAVRMMQGGHFASDVLFAFYAVWLGNWVAWVVLSRLRLLPEGDGVPAGVR